MGTPKVSTNHGPGWRAIRTPQHKTTYGRRTLQTSQSVQVASSPKTEAFPLANASTNQRPPKRAERAFQGQIAVTSCPPGRSESPLDGINHSRDDATEQRAWHRFGQSNPTDNANPQRL